MNNNHVNLRSWTIKRLLIFGLMFWSSSQAWCGFLISKSPAIEGHVTDTATGLPIANAIVIVQWYRDFVISMGPAAKKIGNPVYGITDSNGNYIIKTHLYIPSLGLGGCTIRVTHPFYFGVHDEPIYAFNFKEFRRLHKSSRGIRVDAMLKVRSFELVGVDFSRISVPDGQDDIVSILPYGQLVYLDDYEYFEGAKALGQQPADLLPDWDRYKDKFGFTAILQAMEKKH